MSQIPYKLHGLSAREAITDAIYRAAMSFDLNDWELCQSSLVKSDSTAFVLDGNEMKGMDAIKNVFDTAGPMDTTHMVTNIRVNVDEGADTATATAYGLHQHFRPGEGKDASKVEYFLAGCTYALDFVRDASDGLWKIQRWDMKVSWTQGERAVMGWNSS